MTEKTGPTNLEHLAEIAGEIGEGVAVATCDGTITYANRAWAAMHEYEPEELIGINLSIFHSERQMVEDVEPFNAVVLREGRHQGEVGHVTSSGREFPTIMTTTVLRGDDGRPVEMVAVARDIADLKDTQRALETRGRYLSCLAEISTLMIEARDVVAVLPKVMRLLGETADVSQTYTFINDFGAGGELTCSRVAAWVKSSAPPSAAVAKGHQHLPYVANGLERWIEILGSGRILSGNVADFPASEQRQLASYHIESLLLIPLFVSGRWHGYIGFDCCEAQREWSDHEVSLLKIAAHQIAAAFENQALVEEILLDTKILEQSNKELTRAYQETLEGWARALELRDSDTEGHTRRVADLAVEVGRRMGLDPDELVHLHRGALLHDIGKMAVPDHILTKPTSLDEDEWKIMRQHPVYAHDMLSRIKYLRPALPVPSGHHERWNGSGYPHGLTGEDIPLLARIFAVVDVWDALTSDRPYRPAWTADQTVAYLRSNAGVEFDPRVVEVFLEVLAARH